MQQELLDQFLLSNGRCRIAILMVCEVMDSELLTGEGKIQLRQSLLSGCAMLILYYQAKNTLRTSRRSDPT
jgi:hypothetical protein